MKKVLLVSLQPAGAAPLTHQVWEHLSQWFPGRVVLDALELHRGTHGERLVQEILGRCGAVVAVMEEESGGAAGFLRNHFDGGGLLAAAFQRGLPVVVVLPAGTPLPPETQLPVPLRPLAQGRSVQVRSTHLWEDLNRLVRLLYPLLGEHYPGRMESWMASAAGLPAYNELQRAVFAFVTVLLAAIALLIGLRSYIGEIRAALLLGAVWLTWSIGKQSAKLAWVAHLGAVAAIVCVALEFYGILSPR
jgi:hypothetical protein